MSRMVLIPFPECPSVSPLERWKCDQELSQAMEDAHMASFLIVKMRNLLLSESGMEKFESVLSKVSSIETINLHQRLYMSYSLLLFTTFEVGLIIIIH